MHTVTIYNSTGVAQQEDFVGEKNVESHLHSLTENVIHSSKGEE